MKKYLILVVAILAIAACKSQQPVSTTIYQTKIEKEILHDTIVNVQIKEMFVEKQIKDTASELKTDNAYSKASWSNGMLYHSLEQSGVQPTQIVYKDKISIDTIFVDKVSVQKVEKELSWWQKAFINAGKIFIGLLFLVIVYVVIKVFKKFKIIK